MDHQMRFCGPGVCRAVWLLAALLPLGDTGSWGLTSGSWGLTSDAEAPQAGPHADGDSLETHPRHKRSWVWNQFFVLEEYTGNDPLYVGKVRRVFLMIMQRVCLDWVLYSGETEINKNLDKTLHSGESVCKRCVYDLKQEVNRDIEVALVNKEY